MFKNKQMPYVYVVHSKRTGENFILYDKSFEYERRGNSQMFESMYTDGGKILRTFEI